MKSFKINLDTNIVRFKSLVTDASGWDHLKMSRMGNHLMISISEIYLSVDICCVLECQFLSTSLAELPAEKVNNFANRTRFTWFC